MAQNPAKLKTEGLIFKLKTILEKTGKIDHAIFAQTKGKFIQIIKNHKGSKIFQKFLKPTHNDIIHQIFQEIKQNLDELIVDPYANYFIKKFFPFLSQNDRIEFLKNIENSLSKLSSDSIGTYPIQGIVESVSSKEEKSIIINAIKDHIQELVYDSFGTHVIEKLMSCFEEDLINFIEIYVAENFLTLARNCNGICVVKKILYLNNKKGFHENLKIIIKENALNLIQHPYGNFVIQSVVESWGDYKEIMDLFKNKFFELSLGKYSSNVVERSIEKDMNILDQFIEEICSNGKIVEVMRSNFGNYVVQKALKISGGESKNKVVFFAAKDICKLTDLKLINKWRSILMPHLQILSKEQIDLLKNNNFFV